MKKIISVAILFCFGLIILLKSPIRRNLTKPLRKPIISQLLENNIEQFKLIIDPVTKKYFDDIYELYPKNLSHTHESAEFYNKYRIFKTKIEEKNKWKKANLIYNNKKYEVKIKIHGRSPMNHYDEGVYSIKVKLTDNKMINNCDRFSFIIYRRINDKSDKIKKLSKSFNLITQEDHLVFLRINDEQGNLYYFEKKFDTHFFKKINRKDLISLSKDGIPSLIYTSGNFNEWDSLVFSSIKKQNFNTSLEKKILKTFNNLNNDIHNNISERIFDYFDFDYLSNLYAYIYLTNPSGHGFSNWNLSSAIDTTTFKIYIFTHRDMDLREINTSLFNFNTSYHKLYPNNLFTLLDTSPELRLNAKKILFKYLEANVTKDIEEFNAIQEKHSKLYYSSFLKNLWKKPKNILKMNSDFFFSIEDNI